MSDLKERNKDDYDDVITDTQRGSWNQTQGKASHQDDKVLSRIANSSQGLANFEICELVKRPAHGVSGSLCRLRQKFLIEDTGFRKMNPSSSKFQIVWKATEIGNDRQQLSLI